MPLKTNAMKTVLLIGNLKPANKQVFAKSEAFLKSEGYSVVNPARDYTLSMNDDVYFTRRYLESLTEVDAVFYLPDHYLLPSIDLLIHVVNSLSLHVLVAIKPVSPVIENEYSNF